MCDCVNIEIGSYDNQVELTPPARIGRKPVCIDKCLDDEIKHLWSLGITTTGCCCGHNKQEGYIGVIDSDIPRMKELGYRVHFNSCLPNDEDSFMPKSISNVHPVFEPILKSIFNN